MFDRAKRKSLRPSKESNVIKKIHDALIKGHYRDTSHSIQRSKERKISLPDILEVLETGYHEKKKDEFRADFQSWNYAVRGKTIDGDELRIAVYFEEEMVMIATVIRL